MSEAQSKTETAKAHVAFLRYCEMGIARSLSKLAYQLSGESPQNHTKTTPKTETILRTLKEWSSQHNWQQRVRQYDEEQAERRRIEEEENRRDDWEKIRTMLLKHIDAEVTASPASQIQAAKLLNDHYIVSGDLSEMKTLQEKILKKLEDLGIEL